MKDKIEEINKIHKSLSDVSDKINDLHLVIGTGSLNGRDVRDTVYRERIDLLTEDYNNLKARLKEIVE